MEDTNGQRYEIIIVGAGPAGQTAALYAGRSRIPTLVLERGIPGGELLNTAEVEDYPGFEHIMGPDLAAKMQQHAEKFGAKFETLVEVESISVDGDDRVVKTTDGREFRAPAVIIAAGGEPRKLGIPGEEELAGKGVSYCAVCDGAFFQGAEIAVVGGGDSAVEEGTFLTRYGSKVYLIHRRDGYRAQPILVEQMRASGKVEEILNTVVEEVHGEGRVTHLTLRNVETGEQSHLDVGGFFPFIGFIPHSDIFDDELKEQIELDEEGHIVTNDKMETAVPGIYAAGDVRAQFVRQVTNAVGDATTAALAANEYVEKLKHARSKQAA
jgi:thioredoxin reductase (NADPH)